MTIAIPYQALAEILFAHAQASGQQQFMMAGLNLLYLESEAEKGRDVQAELRLDLENLVKAKLPATVCDQIQPLLAGIDDMPVFVAKTAKEEAIEASNLAIRKKLGVSEEAYAAAQADDFEPTKHLDEDGFSEKAPAQESWQNISFEDEGEKEIPLEKTVFDVAIQVFMVSAAVQHRGHEAQSVLQKAERFLNGGLSLADFARSMDENADLLAKTLAGMAHIKDVDQMIEAGLPTDEIKTAFRKTIKDINEAMGRGFTPCAVLVGVWLQNAAFLKP